MAFDAVFFDLDGTLTTVESPWQEVHRALGLWEPHGTGHLRQWLAGAIDYRTFFDRDVDLWRGRTEAELTAPLDAIPFRPEAAALLAGLRRRSVPAIIVSSGFRRVALRLEREAGAPFACIYANAMRFDGRGLLEGVDLRVSGEAGHALGKKSLVLGHCRRLGLDPGRCLAVGDSASDRPLFEAAGTSVALSETGGFGEDRRLRPGNLREILSWL